MEVNLVNKREFGSTLPYSRLDAEYVWKSLWDIEKSLRDRDGWRLEDLVFRYKGPQINETFCDAGATIKYVDIDSIDTTDGLAYADEILYGDRPSRAKYQLCVGDLLISNVRPNRGAITLIVGRRAGSLASSGSASFMTAKLKMLRKRFFLHSSNHHLAEHN